MLCVCVFCVYFRLNHYCVQFWIEFLCARTIKLRINWLRAMFVLPFELYTVFEFGLVLCVRAPSNSEIIGCAPCSFCLSNMTVFEFWLFLCVRASSNSDLMSCAQCSFDIPVFTVDSLVTESSNSWWLTGWWSDNTHTVSLGDDEYDWWLWWSKSLWRDVRVSTQGTNRFPTWDSAVLQNILAPDLLSVAESSFSVLLVQKRILVHWIYSHKRSGQSCHKSSTLHPLRASVGVKDSECAHCHLHSGWA